MYYMQFQFLKGRYCLSFAVLFHCSRALVNGYAEHGHQSFSDTNLAL